MKLKRITCLFLMVISIFITVTVADELPKHKLTLEVNRGEVLEKDNIEYLEILLQNDESASVIYLEKANGWKSEIELIPGTYKIIIKNISPSKYLISNDYSVTISDKDVVSEISIKEFPNETSESNIKPKKPKKPIKPIKEESKEQQQTTSQTLKSRSMKIANTVILCTLVAAVILIILWFVSKIVK